MTDGEKLRKRIKKKRGLLKDPDYERIKKCLFQGVEEEAALLEARAEHIRLPEKSASKS